MLSQFFQWLARSRASFGASGFGRLQIIIAVLVVLTAGGIIIQTTSPIRIAFNRIASFFDDSNSYYSYCGDSYCDSGEEGWCGDCYTPPSEYCGDGSCNNGESCDSCSGDCGECELPPPPPGDTPTIQTLDNDFTLGDFGQCQSDDQCSQFNDSCNRGVCLNAGTSSSVCVPEETGACNVSSPSPLPNSCDDGDCDNDGLLNIIVGGDDCNDDDPDPSVSRQCWDQDGDGFKKQSLGGDDCNDEDINDHPGAPERCDNADNNCNGQNNEGGVCEYVPSPTPDRCSDGDCDGDSYKNKVAPWNGDDCEDDNREINPGHAEVCNSFDDNCNGEVNEGNVCGRRNLSFTVNGGSSATVPSGGTVTLSWRAGGYDEEQCTGLGSLLFCNNECKSFADAGVSGWPNNDDIDDSGSRTITVFSGGTLAIACFYSQPGGGVGYDQGVVALTVPSPPPTPVSCAPASQVINVGQEANFVGIGDPGLGFFWSAPGGVPSIGIFQAFSSQFSNPGIYQVTVQQSGSSANCSVTVLGAASPTPSVTPTPSPSATPTSSPTSAPVPTATPAPTPSPTGQCPIPSSQWTCEDDNDCDDDGVKGPPFGADCFDNDPCERSGSCTNLVCDSPFACGTGIKNGTNCPAQCPSVPTPTPTPTPTTSTPQPPASSSPTTTPTQSPTPLLTPPESIPPTPSTTPLSCVPRVAVGDVGDTVYFVALNGSGNYTWSAPGLETFAPLTGPILSYTRSVADTFQVSVSDGQGFASCTAVFLALPTPSPSVSPSACPPPQCPAPPEGCDYVNATSCSCGQLVCVSPSLTCQPRPACLDATPPCLMPEPVGSWCPSLPPTPSPSPTSSPGTLLCLPPVQVTDTGAANLVALSGTGTYTWSASGATPSSSTGIIFSTQFPVPAPGTANVAFLVSLSDGQNTTFCEVEALSQPFETTSPTPPSTPSPSPTLTLAPSPTPTPTVSVAVSPSPTPTGAAVKAGDLDSDGDVDIFDYSRLVGKFGQSGANLPEDINGNGTVDIFDYSILVGNFGR